MVDSFGNEVFAGSVDNGAVDTEYSPHSICAQDERFAALEQRIVELEAQAADQGGHIRHLQRTAKILDKAYKKWREDNHENAFWAYVMESVGVVDEREANREPVTTKAVPIGEADTYAHIPKAIWEDMVTELETLRALRVNQTFSDGVLAGAQAAHDAMAPGIDKMQAELETLYAKWENVPWHSLKTTLFANDTLTPAQIAMAETTLRKWYDNHAPKEETGE